MSETGTENVGPGGADRRRATQVQITRPCPNCVTYKATVERLQRELITSLDAQKTTTIELVRVKYSLALWRSAAMAAGAVLAGGLKVAEFWSRLKEAIGVEEQESKR